jgi:homoserine O-acetyltransferase
MQLVPMRTSIWHRLLSTSLRVSAARSQKAAASATSLQQNNLSGVSLGASSVSLSSSRAMSSFAASSSSRSSSIGSYTSLGASSNLLLGSVGICSRSSSSTLFASSREPMPMQVKPQCRPLSTDSDGGEEMKDEYGTMDDSGHTYEYPGAFRLESGTALANPVLRYQTYGKLNEARDNVLVVCHALTGNASLHSWWGDLLGPGCVFDTDKYFVVCCNILGSCYGSTSPVSINPATAEPYGIDFPDISVKDTVRLQLLLLRDELKVNSIKAVIGGSFGGMQAVEFAVQAGGAGADFCDASGDPYCRNFIPIACGAQHTAWQIAISEVQRQAIYMDPEWASGDPFQATAGLEVARQIGMISYRTPVGYSEKFGRKLQDPESPPYGSNAKFAVRSYLEYQGTKFLSRFDPVTYVKMTEQMDSHNVARGRGDTIQEVLAKVQIPALVLGIDSDVLYPLTEQVELAESLPAGQLKIIKSDDGHDGFLLEQDQVAAHILDFLDQSR